MLRKEIAVWVSLLIIVNSIVVIVEIAERVRAPTTLYVGGAGGGNYSKIQWAIDNASDGDTVFVFSGTYFENVIIDKTINLTGESQSSTIIDGGGNGDAVRIEVDWVNITGFRVNGGGSGIILFNVYNCSVIKNNASNNFYGIWIYYSSRITITNNTASNNEYGLLADSGSWNIITNNNVSYNDLGFQSSGMYIYNSSNNTVFNNIVSYNARYGSQFIISHDNNISKNEVSNNIYGIRVSQSTRNKITHNNVSDNIEGINAYESNGIYIKNNTVIRNVFYGIHLSKSESINLTDNTMINNGIRIVGNQIEYWSTHNIETSNTVNGKPVYYFTNQSGGIVPTNAGQVILANCTDIIVKDTELLNCSIGITLGFSMNSTIIHNNVSKNYAWIGIWLSRSDGNKINDNVVSNNYYGIAITSSQNNEIKRNIHINCDYGIHVSGSSGNTIMSNNFSYNNYGVGFSESINNRIFHNNFINNTKQAQDDRSNYWDNGYPSGGNYWSDYAGVDNFKGPNQDQPGSDGIGDTNYLIDSDSIDHYPLMSPYIYKPLENFTVLKQGWNLISIPLIQKDQNLSKVLEMIDGYYDAIQCYNPTNPTDPWKHNKIDKPFGNDLFELNETMSFWIHITNPGDTIFLYNGTSPSSNQTIPLHPGWNMVGYPSSTKYNRSDGLNNLEFGADVDCIQWYDAATKEWHFMGPDDHFSPGRGYWVHATVEALWEVPL